MLWLVLLVVFVNVPMRAERVTVSLDGEWHIGESMDGDQIPNSFPAVAPVPGLVHLSQPAFADVDLFDSREVIANRVRRKELPESALTDQVGIPRQKRNYFWYERSFALPVKKQVAILKINKAQFGTAVWVNGKRVGEHLGCFTTGFFNITEAVNWKGQNKIIVRVGAHPAVLPATVMSGTDFEKTKWTPGIYDSASVMLSDNPVIEAVQIAPRLETSEVVVETRLKNYGEKLTCSLSHALDESASGTHVVLATPVRLALAPGERRTVTQTIRIRGARLWSPESPFLYVLKTGTGGDTVSTRFGMRELRFDTPTKRAYLNGKIYFLRGSNITLHRFFEDPACGSLPWNEKWVRKLLAEIPKKMHWNSFRFCIGPVPERWLDIADEAGLLIQNEFFVWTGRTGYHKEWDVGDMITQYSEWVRDNWNHPSVVIWDANNETIADIFGEKIIPTVRSLDRSNRAWENGYNLPVGPDDPIEDHPYLFSRSSFRPETLETMTGAKSTNSAHPSGHAVILNEYGWLWLNRDGTPTKLTEGAYETLVGAHATAEERFAAGAEMLAGLTEFWRAHRNFAGVLHFVYLTASFPGAYTSDHWADLPNLRLEPHFADYVGEAFKPLGVYLNLWRKHLHTGSKERLSIMMINDYDQPVRGVLRLSVEKEQGTQLAAVSCPFDLPPLGQQTYALDLVIPAYSGKAVIQAQAVPMQGPAPGPTLSRRHVIITGGVSN